MLATIKGYYEHGQIILEELPPVTNRTDVLVTFLTEKPETQTANADGKHNPASFSEAAKKDKEDTAGYVVMESGLGIDE